MVRSFVAVDLPLPGLGFGASEAPTHLTLAFLGDVPEDRVSAVVEALRTALAPLRPFTAVARGVGAFPSPARPRVVWAGVREGAEELGEVARRVRAALDAITVPYDAKPFVPHVTLFRVRSPASRRFAEELLSRPFPEPLGERRVESVDLKGSELGPGGATHRVLARIPFAPEPP